VRYLTAVDVFSGAGGTTQGLRDAGYQVVAAIESDPAAVETFAANHPGTLLLGRDIRRVQAPALALRLARTGHPVDLLTACPPCQPFSTLGSGDATDPRNRLVSSVLRFANALRPRALVLENVPGLQKEPRFSRLLVALGHNYRLATHIVDAVDFGVPQRRRRVIVLGVRRDIQVGLPRDLLSALPGGFDISSRTAGEALAAAEKLSAVEDPVHRARNPQPATLERIRAMKQGGGRLDLPKHLQLACHTRLTGRNATSIYGRIDPDQPAPTMTTRCTTPSCGRFVHPTADRGLTLREAALLQTFPLTYSFHGSYQAVERQIGNAVPPRLAEALGLVVATMLAAADQRNTNRQLNQAA
jgi:DNA (cytosine-5)-methyltransferase 1